jgi:signal transduction histidine kinase
VNQLCVARDGGIWLASKNGIFRVQDGTLQHWGTADGLAGDNVQWICEDKDGSMWAGLAEGIARVKDGKIKNIKLENGLADSWISAIVPDDRGYLWFDSGQGIFRISRQQLNDFADGKTDHVECKPFNGLDAVKSTGRTDQENSGCKTQDGRIWFPCPWGAVMIDPAHVPINPIPPPVHIDRVLANAREFDLIRGVRLVVPPGQGALEIHFTGLSLISPQNVRFRYQLDGYDKDWVEAGNRRVAFYTNLKPKAYTFRVMAANTDGVWNNTGDAMEITMMPHFDQTIWFYLLCSVVGMTVLGSVYAWRVGHLRSRQLALQKSREKLEAEVAKRTSELAQANSSLQREVDEHRATGVLLARRTELLESEIAERERMQEEIERVHLRLLETSRQAGMAEVATNVLHNVGNVLNSVNVSASLVADNARKSKICYLGKAVSLLEEHRTDLGGFMTIDPKGRQLPGYLKQLSEQLTGEQHQAITELELLRQNVEHIKDIVSMQQSYARISGVTEIVKVSDLVEDALRMNTGSLARHEIELIREYSEVPPVNVDKHNVMQILVNLIRNARNACDDSDRPDKKIWLQISLSEVGVQIAVVDNGVGIPPGNLTRIFNHGFTTRKGGHGFGLHSGALAAKELGGSLTVHSEGLGCGATFILKLPLEAPRS